ncbi:uncharacterized protein LOC114188775 isoform X2 [Vigna unguiculata]|uniref:uncharacterized protein LOC114188775 isoform X2 n=1 Tax=Vigna unguiculata TaxID=3917 RepID=UPI001016CD46|nr:uncharacterized protein LOC114188775 isoform X2 [Vigna unguiculata]
MNQVVEKLCNLSLAQSWCEDMQNIISYVSSKYEANATKAISYVILGCFSLLISVLVRRTRSKPKPKPRIRPNRLEATRSFIVRELHSGYPALDRLMTEQYEHPSALDSAHALIRELQKDLPDLLILQQKVRELEMWEVEDFAERILRPALKEANEKEKPHEAYEFEMLIVEVLIYKGGISDLESALQCECLADESLKDARRPLYKVVLEIFYRQLYTKCWGIWRKLKNIGMNLL